MKRLKPWARKIGHLYQAFWNGFYGYGLTKKAAMADAKKEAKQCSKS